MKLCCLGDDITFWHFHLFQKRCFALLCFLQSMLLLAPKLSEKTINNQLLKYFAKLQMDQEVLYGGSVCFLLTTVSLWSSFHLIVEKKWYLLRLCITFSDWL